jgi:hypothetical protein
MKEEMIIISESMVVLGLISFVTPKGFIPTNGSDIFKNIRSGNSKNYRLMYPFFIWGVYHFPESWWQALVMVIAIETATKIVTPFVNWMFSLRKI